MAVKMQVIYRRAREASYSRRLDEASLLIQRIWRGCEGQRRAGIVHEARWRLLTAATIFTQRNARKRWLQRDIASRAAETKAQAELELRSRISIQRWWVSRRARMHFLIVKAELKMERDMAVKIQACYRGHRVRYNKALRKARLVSHWGFFSYYVYHRKFKGEMATLIQQGYRAMMKSRWEHRAATNIQRVWRGGMAREMYAEMLYERAERAALVIQRTWRLHVARRRRKMMIAMRRAAAHSIQRCFRAWRFRKYLRDTRAQALAKRFEGENAFKEQMLEEKHRQLLEGLMMKGQNIAAAKIQRQYKGYLFRKKEAAKTRMREEADRREAMQREERLARMKERKAQAKSTEGRLKEGLKGVGSMFSVKASEGKPLAKRVEEAKLKLNYSVKLPKINFSGRKNTEEEEYRKQMLDGAVMNHHTCVFLFALSSIFRVVSSTRFLLRRTIIC